MIYLKEQVPLASLEKFTESVRLLISNFTPYASNVNPDKKPGIRTMAVERTGIVSLIARIAMQNPDSLSRKDDPAELDNRLELDWHYETLRQALMQMLEYVKDTQFLNSADIMTTFDRFTSALDKERDSNAAVNDALRELDEWNKRFGHDQTNNPDQPTVDNPTK